MNPTFTRRWKAWEHQMGHVGHIKYPRSVGTDFHELHIFADASGEGYGACAYLVTDKGVHLVFAKGKIVKSPSQTIPVLELEALMVAYKVLQIINRVYRMPQDKIHFWSDSYNALSWVKMPARDLPRPIARRSTTLRENTIIENWHHVPGEDNPADVLSRGCKAVQLVDHKLWWHGPKFLSTKQWPPDTIKAKPHVPLPDEPVLAKMVGIFALIDDQEEAHKPKIPTLFLTSNFRRGCRIMFWVKLFIHLKTRPGTPRPVKTEAAGLQLWIRLEQRYHFHKLIHEVTQKGVSTEPEFQSMYFTVMEGILLISGRLRKLGVPLLHKDSLLAKLWLEHFHANVLRHAGGSATLKAETISHFWVWKGTKLYKQVTRDCIACTKATPKSYPQTMAPLPLYRHDSIQPTAFAAVGLDFAGPWWCDQGRDSQGKNLPRLPRYLLVFGCLTFRAVHLEMTYGHSTPEVLQGLQRFASRRGIPSQIVSDNARELKKAAEALTHCARQPVVSYPVSPGWGDVQWTFSTPRSPHTNGATESLVGVAKRAIKHAMPKYNLTDGLLHTVFTYCEEIANKRPLIKNFSDIHDPEVLTPAHFLGTCKGPLPTVTEHGPKNRFTTTWLRVAEIRDKFYHRFQKELTPELEKKAKWWDIRPAPKEGDIVCVLQTKATAFGHWPLGKILELHYGRDGHVRSATVVTQETHLKRSLRHLIPLTDPRTHALAQGVESIDMNKEGTRPLARGAEPADQEQDEENKARHQEGPERGEKNVPKAPPITLQQLEAELLGKKKRKGTLSQAKVVSPREARLRERQRRMESHEPANKQTDTGNISPRAARLAARNLAKGH